MIAIKDMEMPKECYRCPSLDREHGTYNIIGETKVDMTKERAKNCPLVEIITCKDCKHRDPEDKFCDCGHTIKWSSPRDDNFYCADAESEGQK